MNIKIKSFNHKLLLFMNETCSYDVLLSDLKKLLESSFFEKSENVPKAFFDFKSRILTEDDVKQLMDLVNNNRKIIFDGISGVKKKDNIELYNSKIRNGEEVYIMNKTLFLESCNSGGFIYCYDDIYFLNKVKGVIVAYNQDIRICGHCFENVSIYMCGKVIHDVTFFSLSTIYYNGKDICVEREDSYE